MEPRIINLDVGHVPPCEGGDDHAYQLTYQRRWYIGPKEFHLECWECNLRMEMI
jgi:hypothetical protein